MAVFAIGSARRDIGGYGGVVPPGDYCALVKEELRAAGYDLAFS